MTRFLRPVLLGLSLCAAPLALAPSATATTAPVPKASDEELKAQILKLNSLKDDQEATARLRELLKDKEAARRIGKLAREMLGGDDAKKKPLKYNAALVCGKLAQFSKEYESAEALYEFCVASATKGQDANRIVSSLEFLCQVYEEQKKYAAVEDAAQKIIDAADALPEAAVLVAYEKLINAKSKQGETNVALDMVDRLIQATRVPSWPLLEVKAKVYRDAGRYDDAVAAYEEVIKAAKADDRLEDEQKDALSLQVRYIMTGVHVDAKQTAKAVKLLKEIVKEKPDVATYRNDLGFIMADANLELDRAETEVRKALELDKEARAKLLDAGKIDEATAKQENAAYLDSLGWVLYRRGKFDEALRYLEVAMKDPDEGNHIEIFDHVADCLLAVGRKDEAVSVWEKSLKLQDVSPRDVDRRKKVTEKLKKAKQ